MLSNLLKPRQVHRSIYDINLKSLWDKGYRYIIIDVDNTLTAWNNYNISQRLLDWILLAKKTGFGICLLSNSSQSKIQEFASKLGVISSPAGGKPFKRAFSNALDLLQANEENTLVIGDQIFTDILGGNRAGLYTILVDPIDKKEFFWTKINRLLERIIAGRKTSCK
jgi:HAD superfamily phosphatase (TIGR01668 family)